MVSQKDQTHQSVYREKRDLTAQIFQLNWDIGQIHGVIVIYGNLLSTYKLLA